MLALSHSAPTSIVTSLNAMIGILEKAEAHAAEKKIDQSVFLHNRLYPDMFPFARQIQIASNHARNGLARLAGVESPSYDENETSFAQLRERLEKSIAFIKTIDPAKIEAGLARPVQFPMGPVKAEMPGGDHLSQYLIPNIYFHLSTAYAILRKSGLNIGKMDFLGKIALTRI